MATKFFFEAISLDVSEIIGLKNVYLLRWGIIIQLLSLT